MLKKTFSIGKVGLIGLMVSVVATSSQIVYAGSFPDVLDSNVHLKAIEFLKQNSLVGGYPDGTFKPDNTINRAEALKIIFLARKNLYGEENIELKKITFPDVKISDWFYDYVVKAFSLEVVKGYEDGKFKPANEITAAESVKMIILGLDKNYQTANISIKPFTDVDLSSWAATYLDYARIKQFVEAEGDGSYKPDRQMTRAEFAEVVYRVFYTSQNKLDKYPISMNWNYCRAESLGYKVKQPTGWQIMASADQLILWRRDFANGQVSFARVYPNSAVAVVAVDRNNQKLNLEEYLNQIEYGSDANKQVMTLNGMPYASVFLEQSGLQDSYFQMPNGNILVIYAQIGDGELKRQMTEEIRYMLGSLRQSESTDSNLPDCFAGSGGTVNSPTVSNNAAVPSDLDKIKEEILKLVLINGAAEQALGKLEDEILFDTDTIGIGTGPVDYYYTAKLDLTLKIDRNSATVLASKAGKTSAF
ncbi:S-layer homology domain-containing protein [Candidatus Peregrinibacteria bacterium]|nr:S-layer homology domain-containing protein [Candidatus Peregrinibacteria bacterium]